MPTYEAFLSVCGRIGLQVVLKDFSDLHGKWTVMYVEPTKTERATIWINDALEMDDWLSDAVLVFALHYSKTETIEIKTVQ